MENIQFTFKHNLNNNFLEIEGSKTFNNKIYVCSVYDKIDKIDLQEVLRKITISIQNGIIEDLSSEDNKCVTVTLRTQGGEYLGTMVVDENNCSEIIYESDEICVKVKRRK